MMDAAIMAQIDELAPNRDMMPTSASVAHVEAAKAQREHNLMLEEQGAHAVACCGNAKGCTVESCVSRKLWASEQELIARHSSPVKSAAELMPVAPLVISPKVMPDYQPEDVEADGFVTVYSSDRGEWLPGQPWPSGAVANEPQGVFSQTMHTKEDIARPEHYARYPIEPITFIMANKLLFPVGNVIKYVCRYDAKNGMEDLVKAKRYLDMLIEDETRRANGTLGDVVGRPL